MSLAFVTLCQSKIHNPPMTQPFPKPAEQIPNKILSAYQINVLAALGELTLGLPLDRIKIGLQSGSTYREIFKQNMVSSGQISVSRSPEFGSPRNLLPTRFRTNISYWFAGHTPSIINRCFIYLPGIAFLNSGYSNHIEPWLCDAGSCSRPISQIIVKPIIVSALISPYVSLFEGFKLVQQLGHQKVYPQEINKFISVSTPITYQPSIYQLVRGVINSGKPGILFASFWPTFARETAFICGMCAIQPRITNHLITAETDISGALFSPMMSSSNTIALLSSETARVLGSLVASFGCQTISQPFDVLKTRRECNPATQWSQLIENMKTDIKNKGARVTLFAGWLPRCIRGVWTFYSVSVIRDWLS